MHNLPVAFETSARLAAVSSGALSEIPLLGILPEICTSGLKKLSIGSSLSFASGFEVICEFSDANNGSAEC